MIVEGPALLFAPLPPSFHRAHRRRRLLPFRILEARQSRSELCGRVVLLSSTQAGAPARVQQLDFEQTPQHARQQ